MALGPSGPAALVRSLLRAGQLVTAPGIPAVERGESGLKRVSPVELSQASSPLSRQMCPSSRKGWARSSRAAGAASHSSAGGPGAEDPHLSVPEALLDSPVPAPLGSVSNSFASGDHSPPHPLLQRPICLYSLRTLCDFCEKESETQEV